MPARRCRPLPRTPRRRSPRSTGLYPGAYTINETSLPAGWLLTDITCNDGSEEGSAVNVQLDIGENVTCTYTNDKQESDSDLSIVKSVTSGPTSINGGDDQQIDYTLTVDNNGPDDAVNDATVTDVLPSGASLVSIDPPAGVTCGSRGSDDHLHTFRPTCSTCRIRPW